jgi:sugar (pentulose or hexulose) kinase
MDEVWAGLQGCYRNLVQDVRNRYETEIHSLAAIGISAMMHGYIATGETGELLTPFRTWRNTTAERAADTLTEYLSFNIPERWSVAHLYQFILDGDAHVPQIRYLTTLAGYVHRNLTGRNVLGVGDASGMFPIDSVTGDFHAEMLQQFDALITDQNYPWRFADILPEVLSAGEDAGALTAEGAKLLDPTGQLASGIPLCPPEGDAGTGMVATNSVAEHTGNISAGTSIFAMLVLEKEQQLSKVYQEIDMVTTPAGQPVAMVHCNNCTTELDAWANVFRELTELFGAEVSKPALYDALYAKALEGDADAGGLLDYNYYGGEFITRIPEGRPLFVRTPDSRFTLANFMRAQLYATVSTLRIGMDILFEREQVSIDHLMGHGGLFKTKVVGQQIMATALGVPVSVLETAGEGGAWGIALLAAYLSGKTPDESLEDFLEQKVFQGKIGSWIDPNPKDAVAFAEYMEQYKKGLAIESAAVDCL